MAALLNCRKDSAGEIHLEVNYQISVSDFLLPSKPFEGTFPVASARYLENEFYYHAETDTML